jgi:CRISPR-associated protein Csy1
MPSMPPELKKNYTRLPKSDFFKWLYLDDDFKTTLAALHKLLLTEYKSVDIRNNRKRRLGQLFEWVLARAFGLQQQPEGWSKGEGVQLPTAQKLWLDSAWFDQREQHDDWQKTIARQISEWVLTTYRKQHDNKAVPLGETEAKAFQQELLEYVHQHKEFIL